MAKKSHQRHNTDFAMFNSKEKCINIVGTIKR